MDTAGVSKVSDLLSKYGVGVVLLAVFIVAFIVAFSFFLKYVNSALETMKEQNAAMFAQLLKPTTEPKILDTHLKVNDMVEQQLRRLRDATDADRAYIYMFHNTDHGIGGFPFLKASCFYEWSLSTVMSLMGKQKDIPVFLLSCALKQIGRGKPFVINDILSQKDQYPALATYMCEVDSRSAVLYPLKSPTGGAVGFIGIDFTALPIDQPEVPKLISEIQISATVIQEILNSVKEDSE